MHRTLDILLSGFALAFLAPFLLPVAFLLRVTGEGEVFFSQERVGVGGGTFKLLKFATMLKNSPNIGTRTITTSNDPRILPMGRFLRKTKVNELPQLVNIFRGDMSIIGPRPLTREAFEKYSSELQSVLVTIPPGLSGIGSIVFRNEEEILKNVDNYMEVYARKILPYKGRLEKWYIENRTIFNYLKAIVVTAWVVVIPSSQIVYVAFRGLPDVPQELEEIL